MRGMYAVEDIKNGEKFLYVPDHLLVTSEKILESSLGKTFTEKKLAEGRLSSPKLVPLALNNLEEISKGEDSYFARFYEVLPGVEDFPIYFTE